MNEHGGLTETQRTFGGLLVLLLAGVLLYAATPAESFGRGAGTLMALGGLLGLVVALIRSPRSS